MTNTHRDTGGAIPSLTEAVERLAFPVFLFSCVLFCFLFLSWILILPYLSQVRMGDERRSIRDLQSYHRELTERLQRAEDSREDLVFPIHDPIYSELRSKKLIMPSLAQLMDEIRMILAGIVPDVPDAIHLERWHVDAEKNVLSLRGRIHNVGPRSMTVLAQMTDALRESSLIASLEEPAFARVEDADGFFSPFVIRMQITIPATQ